MNTKYLNWLKRIPKNQISYAVGNLMETKLPGPLSTMSVQAFCKAYKINMDEAEKPLSAYATIADLFTRKLKPGVRPIQGDLVHCADAKITEAGFGADGILIQAKGINYTVEDLLGDHDLAEKFHGGLYATYYLCPTDYHRVHAPVTGNVVTSVHIPGTLWPVNEWSVKNVRHLFAINERLVTILESEAYGDVAVVMVGATNVGKMTVTYDETLVTNVGRESLKVKHYSERPVLQAGDELGTFHMGSTVIVLFGPDRVSVDPKLLKGSVKVGERLVP